MMEILARGSWNFALVQLFLSSWIVDCLLPEARMVCTVYISQGSWNFEFSTILNSSDISLLMENSCLQQFFEVIQLFFDNWIADCLV